MGRNWVVVVGLAFAGIAGSACARRSEAPQSRDALLNAAADTDRVVVVYGGMAPDHLVGRTAFRIDGADIGTLIRAIEWERVPDGRCACDGNYHIELYRGDELRVSLGYHHGKRVRWRNSRWPFDVDLTPNSRAGVERWFSDRGFTGFRALHEDEVQWPRR